MGRDGQATLTSLNGGKNHGGIGYSCCKMKRKFRKEKTTGIGWCHALVVERRTFDSPPPLPLETRDK